jgi:hypothetical protein
MTGNSNLESSKIIHFKYKELMVWASTFELETLYKVLNLKVMKLSEVEMGLSAVLCPIHFIG